MTRVSKNCDTGQHDQCKRCGCTCHPRRATAHRLDVDYPVESNPRSTSPGDS